MAGSNYFVEVVNSDGNTENIAFTDANNLPTTVRGTTVPSTGSYAKGCIFVKTDAGTGVKALYENQGTTSSPSFNLIGEITAGEITLAEGNVLVGNSSGVGVALDIGATDTGIAIGNGTTATIASLSGDVTMTNAGVVSIGAAKVAQSQLAYETASVTVLAAATTGTATVTLGDIVLGYYPTSNQDQFVASIAISSTTLTITLGAAATADNVFTVVMLKA